MRNFRKDFMTNQKNFSKNKFKPIGIVLHETATPGATAKNELKAFNTHDWKASAHGFIDWEEDLQTLPWDTIGWHACSPANSMFIGIEMCRPKNDDPRKIDKMTVTYLSAVDAFARLYKYVLKIDKVTKDNCMSHDEVRLKWNNTTHTDPTAYLKELKLNMDDFRKDVQNKLKEMK